jgi:TorA maturation chaperone TorD
MEPWVSGFCEDLQKAPAADFYQSVAQLATTFFGVEARYLAMPV